MSREDALCSVTFEWKVSGEGDIIISKVTMQDNGNCKSEVIVHIPPEALRLALINVTGVGDGASGSGEVQ